MIQSSMLTWVDSSAPLLKEHSMLRACARRLLLFLRRDDGPTTVEYAVILSLIISVCMMSVSAMGKKTRRTFRNVNAAMTIKP